MVTKYYFKKTFSGMVLMVLHTWDDDGKEMSQYFKATESEAQNFLIDKTTKEGPKWQTLAE